ncbi:helix-turn-helix domain-containing protein [Methylobacterium komagatae]|uniref:Helix-turn-helix domain-containing protein n=1 Tax=Methylobacterium komagatae TaxID=374425 RepID=A0ABW2BQ72_9HYPH
MTIVTIVRTVTPAGEAIVILPEAEFDRLRDLAEEAADARIAEVSEERLRVGEEELLSEADLDALRRAPTPLAFWRARRGLSLEALSRESGVPTDILQALESGVHPAEARFCEALARILGVEAEDIAP